MANFIAKVYATLKDNGIETKELSVKEAIEKYNELEKDGNTGQKAIDDNKIIGYNELTEKEVENLLAKEETLTKRQLIRIAGYYEKRYSIGWKDSGNIDDCLNDILIKKGWNKPPTRIDKNEYTRVFLKSGILYRGFNGDKAEEYKNSFLNGEIFTGRGIAGNGIYLTKNKNKALMHANNKEENIALVLFPFSNGVEANMVNNREYKEFLEYLNKRCIENGTHESRCIYDFFSDYGKYCALKGVKAYYSIYGDEDIVILDRSILYIKEI